MTEDEAKTKWCPFVRMPMKLRDQFHVANRVMIDGIDDGPKCIGSACMAWRWARPYWKPLEQGESSVNRGMRFYDGSGNEVPPPSSETDGFCGLAGKP